MKKSFVQFQPKLKVIETIVEGNWGIIFSHGERSFIEEGLFPILSKKLKQREISSVLFNFPFRMEEKKRPDDIGTIDQAFLTVWNYVISKFPNKRWCVGGHDIGALAAIRVSGLIFDDKGIPPIIGLSYPMYPPNRPEFVDTSTLSAIMGDALFCQGEKSARGSFNRLQNQIRMMAGHVHVQSIKGANHQLEVPEKSMDTVAYWISKDIEKFFKNLKL